MTGHAVLDQIASGGAGPGDRAGRADMVGGDGIEEQAEDAGILDIADRRRLALQALEIGRVLHIGGIVVPAIGEAVLRGAQRLPALIALEDVGIAGLEQLPA